MITVSNAVDQIIKKKSFLEEAINSGIINLSALARQILPEVRKETFKEVREGAVLMALKRRPKTLASKFQVDSVLEKNHDLILRSNLLEFTILNSSFSPEKHKKIIEAVENQNRNFLTITQGIFETTIIVSRELKDKVKAILEREKIIYQPDHLSSITIRLPEKNVLTPGVYYTILKFLAWERINVVEVVSTFSEFTIILESQEISRAFSILKNALS